MVWPMLWSGRLWALAGLSVLLGSCSGPEPEGDPTGVVSQAWTASACGTVLGTFDGTAAKSNGANTGTGSSCAGTGTYGLQYQCVELVMRHFKTHWNLRWYGNAKDLLAHAKTASYFQTGSPADVAVYTNGDGAHPPVAGDMIVWTTGTYGHVALVTNVTTSKVEILEQNVSGVTPQGKYTLGFDGKTVAGRWGGVGPAGWVHAKKNVLAAPDAGAPKDSGLLDGGADTGADAASDAAEDAGPDDAADPTEPGLGDPIVAPPGADAPAEDTAIEGSCSYGRPGGPPALPPFESIGLGLALVALRTRRQRS